MSKLRKQLFDGKTRPDKKWTAVARVEVDPGASLTRIPRYLPHYAASTKSPPSAPEVPCPDVQEAQNYITRDGMTKSVHA
jgi:hypothetical protein